MRNKYDWLAIYDWSRSQIQPFSAYELENQFNISRNSSKSFLRTNPTIFLQTPGSRGSTRYALAAGVTVDEFLAAVKGKTVIADTNELITNSLGTFDLRMPELPPDICDAMRFVANNSKELNILLANALDIAGHNNQQLSPEVCAGLIKYLGKAYPAVAVLKQLADKYVPNPALAENDPLIPQLVLRNKCEF